MKQHLVKSFYSLRLLKTRSIKAKMIQALNFFRGVQKRLAFEVREFASRERGLGGQLSEEALIGPQFGVDDLGNLKAKKADSQGPGRINANQIDRELDEGQATDADGKPADVFSLKGYKYNKMFDSTLSSTCPCVPRFHSTFGRPCLYEEVSAELDSGNSQLKRRVRDEGKNAPAFKDRLVFKRFDKLVDSEIAVIDEHGIRVVYQESLNDVLMLEEEMVKIGSHYINKLELELFEQAGDSPLSLVDRGQVAYQLFEQEFELQVVKIEIVQVLLEVYEHTTDPLEAIRII